MKEKVESARFAAMDGAGRIFQIIAYQCSAHRSDDNEHTVVPKGEIEYWTDTGSPVRNIDSETFRIATTRETVTSFY